SNTEVDFSTSAMPRLIHSRFSYRNESDEEADAVLPWSNFCRSPPSPASVLDDCYQRSKRFGKRLDE
ncbi:hypothetical protein, partial [Rhodopirellula europaea]|uniref:hypothetical protein n=1 Tax=Rhodopirellula europaea TaxID=1263866 RepID=UPI0028F407A9